MQPVQPILIRWPNDESGGYFKVPGVIVGPNKALALFDRHLEIHLVAATNDPNEYDLQYASNPMFHVGENPLDVFYDVHTLTVAEFAGKYGHSDFAV